MQVIGAGFGRTGTMSMQAALQVLGYRCYHMKEVTEHADHLQAWHQFVAGRASMDWQTLFKDFEATVDFPACIYYRELLREFPHAKVVLNVRDPDRWFDSFLTLQQTTDRFRVFRFIPALAAFSVLSICCCRRCSPIRAIEHVASRSSSSITVTCK